MGDRPPPCFKAVTAPRHAFAVASRVVLAAMWDRHFVPRPLRNAAEWAEQELRLTTEETEDAGRFRMDRTPYSRAVLEVLSPQSLTRIVSFMAPAQVTKTLTGLILIGHRITDHPCSIWAVFPTDLLAKDFKRDRFDPIVDSTPALRACIPKQRPRDGGHTKTFVKFPGGSLKFVGANVPWALRSKPIKVLIEEEYDALARSLKGEGTASGIVEARCRRARRAKIYRNSTPTVAGVSAIAQALSEAETLYDFHVPCPACGVLQVLQWEQVRYEKPSKELTGRVESVPGVTIECTACHVAIEERSKAKMKATGQWVTRWSHGNVHVGFDGSSLALLAERRWGEMAAKYERATRDVEVMREFQNLELGRPYEEETNAPDTDDLYARREAYPAGEVPVGARVLVAGVDVQEGWLACEVVAYGRVSESWSVDYRVIVGATNDPTAGAWKELRDRVLSAEWPCAGGGTLAIRCMAIDTGHNADVVYAFCRESQRPVFSWKRGGVSVSRDRTVMPIKGRDEWHRPISTAQVVSADEKKRGVRVVLVGVSMLRHALYQWLNLTPGDVAGGMPPRGLCHFPADEIYSREYFAELTAAVLETVSERGFKRLRWRKPKNVRHEAGDARVYARAASIVAGVDRARESDWRTLEKVLPSGLLAVPAAPRIAPATVEEAQAPLPPAPAPDLTGRVTEPKRTGQVASSWMRRYQ